MTYTMIVVDSPRAIPARRRYLVRRIYEAGGHISDFGDVLLRLDDTGTPRAVYQFVVGPPLAAPPVDVPGFEADVPDDVWACTCDPDLAAECVCAARWWACEYSYAPAVPGPQAGTGWVAGLSDWPRAANIGLH